MTKAEFIGKIAEKTDKSKDSVDQVLTAAVEVIIERVNAGDSVTLAGLGSFSLSERAARAGRNPKTGEVIEIPASKAIKFKLSKAAKDAVN